MRIFFLKLLLIILVPPTLHFPGNAEGAAHKIFIESGMTNSLEPWKENVQVIEIEE